MDFLWVYSLSLGSWVFLCFYVDVFSFKSTYVFFVQSLRLCLLFGIMVLLCSFRFAYMIIRKR
jgi:ABC-type spermidine/putrescine transport system permease subunit I